MRRLLRKLSYANVMSTIALFAALSGTAWAAATIGASDIRKNAIRTAHIKNGQIQRADLRNALVNTPKLANGAVRANKIANGSVNRNKLANNAVNSAKLADGSVENADLAADAVDAGKIADGVLPTVESFELRTSLAGTTLMFAHENFEISGVCTATDVELRVRTAVGGRTVWDSQVSGSAPNTGAFPSNSSATVEATGGEHMKFSGMFVPASGTPTYFYVYLVEHGLDATDDCVIEGMAMREA